MDRWGHRTSKQAPEEPTLLIVNASGRFGGGIAGDEEENFDMPENDFDGEKGTHNAQSFNTNVSARPPRPSANVSGATTGGFGSPGKPLASSYKKVHNMPQANTKKRYLAAGANSFNSFHSNKDNNANLRGSNQTPLAMTNSSSAGSLHNALQSKAKMRAHNSLQHSGLGASPGKAPSLRSQKSRPSVKNSSKNKPLNVQNVSPMALLLGGAGDHR